MKSLWLGVFLLSLSWLFLMPVYEPAHWGWMVFLSLGVAIACIAFRRCETRQVSLRYALLGIPLVLFIASISWPYNLGAILLALALAVMIAARLQSRIRSIAIGIGFSGLVLLSQALLYPFYAHVAARMHVVPAFDPVIALLVNLFGGSASFNEQGLFVQTANGLQLLYTTWEGMGAFILLNLAAGSFVIFLFFERVWSSWAKPAAIMLIYAAVRYFVLIFASASFETSDIFWLRPWVILSFAPLPFLLMRMFPLSSSPWAMVVPWELFNRKSLAVGGVTFIAALTFTGALLFHDPGVRKQGRVLFDEGHSNWEWMERPYDTEWYGEQSGYNYYNLGELIKHYYRADIRREPLSPDLLSKYDVLVLKTPTSAYSNGEVRAVVDFVKNGGGLWLIGDHTNVFGMGTYLNEMAKEFGFKFKYDATYDLATGNLSLYRPDKILHHPATNNLPFYMFATSCSLDAPLLSENVIVGYGLKSGMADYSQRSFFPKDAHSLTAIEYGLLLQSAAAKFGDGRVLLYTDSTCFSNFYMFMPGKPELALGSIEWLNRKNRYSFVNYILLVLSVISFGVIFTLVKRGGIDRKELVAASIVALLLGFFCVVWLARAIGHRWYAPPTPHTSYPVVVFDGEHSRYYLPVNELKSSLDSDIHTFYVWTQRLGIYPTVKYKFTDGLKDNDALVIINPEKPFTEKEVSEFIKYVEKGGKVLLMDDPGNILRSTAYQLLRPFDMRIDYQSISQGVVEDNKGNVIVTGRNMARVEGGEPYLFVKLMIPQNINTQVNQPFGPAGANPVIGIKTPQNASAAVKQVPGAATNKPAQVIKTPAVAGQSQPATPNNALGNVARELNYLTPNPQLAALNKNSNPPGENRPVNEVRLPIMAIKKKGNGMIAVLGSTHMFTAQVMGATATVPDEHLRKVYDLEYAIFRDLMRVGSKLQTQTHVQH